LSRFIFFGDETVHVEVKEATKTVVVHVKELLIHSATFTSEQDGKSQEVGAR
jgi:hypothetical protein